MRQKLHERRGAQRTDYFHGYSSAEQQRLIRQAEYWQEQLIPIGLSYRPGERVLEIGCAAGASLGVLARLFPEIKVAGADIEPRQIEFAKSYLKSCGVEADLRVADGANLPWVDGHFDHVYVMWLLEHLKDSTPLLREANRVLRSQGAITITETDYSSFKVTPLSSDWDYLERAQYEFFLRHGNPVAGRELGVLLRAAGFANVTNAPVGFHFFHGTRGFREHVEYVLAFMEPGLPKMASLGFDEARLRKGIEYLRSIPDRADGSFTTIVYRAHGAKKAP